MADDIISQFKRNFNFPIETNRLVGNYEGLLNIPTGVRWEGMLVHVSGDQTYQLKGGITNSDWVPFTPSFEAVVIDDLTSNQTQAALSANQGRILKGLVDSKMRWRGSWSPIFYDTYDVVNDDGWLMIANKPTADPAAPQESGDPFYLFDGLLTRPQANSKQVIVGQRYTFPREGFINGFRIRTVAGNHYVIYVVRDPLGAQDIEEIFEIDGADDQWLEFGRTPTLANAGVTFDIIMIIREQDPVTTSTFLNYNYVKPQNTTIPLAGQITHSAKELFNLYIHYTDDDGNDNTAYLQSISEGDIISTAGVRWSVQNVTPEANYIILQVAPGVQAQGDGLQTFEFEVTPPVVITYALNQDYWLGTPAVSGLFSLTGAADITVNDNQYGIDLLVQEANISQDWDVMSAPGGGGGGAASAGGGSDNVFTFPSLATFPVVGEDNVIYIDTSTTFEYYWDGAAYQQTNTGRNLSDFNNDLGFLTPTDPIDADTLGGNPPSFYLDRTNHTNTQAISTIDGLQTALDGKLGALIDDPTPTLGGDLNFNGYVGIGNFEISTQGAGTSSPRILGFTGLGSGATNARFQFGDPYNIIETQYGRALAMSSYNTLYLEGGRQSLTDYPIGSAVNISGISNILVNHTAKSTGIKMQGAADALKVFDSSDATVFTITNAGGVLATDTVNATGFVVDGQTGFLKADGSVDNSTYLTSFTETDPTVPSHVKSITTTEKANWNTAFSWGNHADEGYLTSFTETDPTVPQHVKDITTGDIVNWNNHFSGSYGDLTGVPTEFNPIAHTHPWSEVTGKPTSFPPSAHTHTVSEITDFPTNVSYFTNDAGYLTSGTLPPYPNDYVPVTGGNFNGNVFILDAQPVLGLRETDTTTAARFAIVDGITQLQAGGVGADDTASSGSLYFSGYFDQDILEFKVRSGGAWQDIYHTGNLTPFSGDYNDLINKPTIPVVNNGTLTLSTGVGLDGSASFTANQSTGSNFTVTQNWNELPLTTKAALDEGWFAVIDDGQVESRILASDIGLSTFNNDLGFITGVAWGDITGKPSTFPPSAHTHPWTEITGKPTTFPPESHTHTKSQITDFAHTHPWSEITGKPTTFTPSAHTHVKADITDFAHTHTWGEITGKPTTFTPSAHTHVWADITDRPTNVSFFTNDAGYLTSIPSTYLQSGDNVSELVNDSGYLTSFNETDPTVPAHVKAITTGDIANWNDHFSGDYNDLTNKPTIPAPITDYVPDTGGTFTGRVSVVSDTTPNISIGSANANQTTPIALDLVELGTQAWDSGTNYGVRLQYDGDTNIGALRTVSTTTQWDVFTFARNNPVVDFKATPTVNGGAIPINIVTDTTPQLGGSLDMNGNKISTDFFIDTTGSSRTSPRVFGSDNWAGSEAMRFTFGDVYNGFQSGRACTMDIFSYNAIRMYGRRTTLDGGLPIEAASSWPDASVQMYNYRTDVPVLLLQPLNAQTADLMQFRDNVGAVLSSIDAQGRFVGDGSLLTGVNASQLNGQSAAYYLNYNNFTNTPQNLSDFNNDIGAGGSYLAGVGLTLTGNTFDLDLFELPTSTNGGVMDYIFVTNSSGTQYKLPNNVVRLSRFDNDAGFITSGDIPAQFLTEVNFATKTSGSLEFQGTSNLYMNNRFIWFGSNDDASIYGTADDLNIDTNFVNGQILIRPAGQTSAQFGTAETRFKEHDVNIDHATAKFRIELNDANANDKSNLYLGINDWYNFNLANGYLHQNFFGESNGTNWVLTHPTLRMFQKGHNGNGFFWKVSSNSGTVGATASLTDLLRVQTDRFEYMGNDIYHEGNPPPSGGGNPNNTNDVWTIDDDQFGQLIIAHPSSGAMALWGSDGQYWTFSRDTDTSNIHMRLRLDETAGGFNYGNFDIRLEGNGNWSFLSRAQGGGSITKRMEYLHSVDRLDFNADAYFPRPVDFGGTGRIADYEAVISTSDSYQAQLSIRGGSQGTGILFIGQSATYGGGIAYEGDTTPPTEFYTASDNIVHYRRSNGTDTWVMRYQYLSDSVYFNGTITQNSTRVYAEPTRLRTPAVAYSTPTTIPWNPKVLDDDTRSGQPSTRIGFLASDIEATHPEFVVQEDIYVNDGAGTDTIVGQEPKTIDIFGLMIAKIAELEARIATLEGP